MDGSITTVRAWFIDRGVDEFRWLVGLSATPTKMVGLLLSRGAVRDEAEPELTAMVLDHEPPSVTGVAVRPVVSLPDYAQMEAIYEEVFGKPSTEGRDQRAERRAGWAAFQATPGASAFLAELDGTAVAYGVMARTEPGPTLQSGGVTLPEARGRGAYRALVHARWEAARRVGAPSRRYNKRTRRNRGPSRWQRTRRTLPPTPRRRADRRRGRRR